MKTLLWNAFYSTIVIIALSACSSVEVGGNLKHVDDDLILNRTTKADVIKLFGEPKYKSTLTRDGVTFESSIHVYAAALGKETQVSEDWHKTATRVLGLYYLKDILVGKTYFSTFKTDSTDFDVKAAAAIKRGMTKKEVLATLGQPSGELIQPLTGPGVYDEYEYTYGRIPTEGISIKKVASIAFDKRDTVITATTQVDDEQQDHRR